MQAELSGPGAKISVLKEGYSKTSEQGEQKADGTITLIQCSDLNIVVDTGGPWDKQVLLEKLNTLGLEPENISYVVGTHGHSDHIGNLNLFSDATFIVSFDISKDDTYIDNDLSKGKEFVINSLVSVIPTPGHTSSDVSVVVEIPTVGTVVVAGDLFECEEDLQQSEIWEENSENVFFQKQNRCKVLKLADYIVPGHGPMFKVPEQYKL